jgi:hypothetical protein
MSNRNLAERIFQRLVENGYFSPHAVELVKVIEDELDVNTRTQTDADQEAQDWDTFGINKI